MKLSDAIALGRMTVPKLLAGKLKGCALGMACNAAGITTKYHGLEEMWPWLKRRIKFPSHSTFAGEETFGTNAIFCMFDQEVMQGTMTLDQLIDWVRSVEPAEPDSHIVEAEEFRAKHDLHPAIPAEEISEVMGLAELGLLPKICPACATKHGEQQCWGQGCQCKCQLEAA